MVLLGGTSYLPYDALLDDHTAALGDLLEVDDRGAHGVVGDRSRTPRARLTLSRLKRPGSLKIRASRPIDSPWKLALSSQSPLPTGQGGPWRNGSAGTAG